MRIEADNFERSKQLGIINAEIQGINTDLKHDGKELEIFSVYKNFVEEIIGMKFEEEIAEIREHNSKVER